MTTEQAPWLLPCGCVRATIKSPLDHRPDCHTRRPDRSTFNISEAASWVVLLQDDPEMGDSHRLSALMVWKALTGLNESDAVDYARRLTDDAHPHLRAYTSPL